MEADAVYNIFPRLDMMVSRSSIGLFARINEIGAERLPQGGHVMATEGKSSWAHFA